MSAHFNQEDGESLGTCVRLFAVQMPFLWASRLGSSLHFRAPTETKSMRGVGRQARLPKVLLFLGFAVPAGGLKGSCESSLLQTHAASEPVASCLSFIHIPKTGGFSMEVARLDAAGIDAPEGHSICRAGLHFTWRGQGRGRYNQLNYDTVAAYILKRERERIAP